MLKSIWLVMLTICFATISLAQTSPWHEEPVSPHAKKDFVKTYVAENCQVNVFRDGKGVQVVSTGRISIAPVRQIATIRRGRFRRLRFKIRSDVGQLTPVKNDAAWDIFAVDCMDFARQLPQDVKVLFAGIWGLQ